MRRILVYVLLVVLALGVYAPQTRISAQNVTPGVPALGTPGSGVPVRHSGKVVAVFNSESLPANYAEVIASAGGEVDTAVPEIGVVSARARNVSGDALLRNLRRDPSIYRAGYDIAAQLVAPAQVLPEAASVAPALIPPPPSIISGLPAADRYYRPAADNNPPSQWAIYRVGGFGGGIYGLTGGAWDVTTGSSAVTVAILDTGISSVHPDLAGKIVDAQSTIFGTTANLPYDDGTPDDQHGHGTFTSSLAAAKLDNTGGGDGAVVGVAPGVKLANLKVLVRTSDGGAGGDFTWTIAAIVYAANQGYQVISMSLAGFADHTDRGDQAAYMAMLRATNYAFSRGSLLVAAAGNHGLRLDNLRSFVELPGSLPNVIAVTATDNPDFNDIGIGTDHLAFYSNFGDSLRALAAPGGDFPLGGALGNTGFIRGACSPGKADVSASQCFDLGHEYYVRAMGTSASAALVSGAAALVFSVNPTLPPSQVRAILNQTAQDIGKPGHDGFFGFGLVDARAAVLATPRP